MRWTGHHGWDGSEDFAACVLDAEAWLVTNPSKASRKRDAVKFMHNWFKTEEAG